MPVNRSYKRELVSILCQTTNPQVMLALLQDLLTPKEFNDIAVRWQTLKLLDKNIPQRNIAKKLGISVAKVTHGSRVLQAKPKGFRAVMDQNYS